MKRSLLQIRLDQAKNKNGVDNMFEYRKIDDNFDYPGKILVQTDWPNEPIKFPKKDLKKAKEYKRGINTPPGTEIFLYKGFYYFGKTYK